jgi:Predicted integral membrane protein (DUF2269)
MDALGLVGHVFVATLAFGFAITRDFVIVAVAKSRQVETIRTVYETAASYGRWIGPLFGLAVLLGFFLAIERHEGLTQRWLIITYVLVLLGMGVGIGLGRRRTLTILEAARNAGATMTPQLDKAIAGAQPIGAWLMLAIMAVIIALMFLKPFSSFLG